VAVIKLAAAQIDAGDGIIHNRTGDLYDDLPVAALGSNPQPGAALYLGFSELPTETPVGLAFRFQGTLSGNQERARISLEEAARQSACRKVLPDIICEDEEDQPHRPVELPPPHHSAEIVWEVSAEGDTDTWTRLEPVTGLSRPEVAQIMDDTRSLTLDGIVEINVPPSIAQRKIGEVDTPLFYLRVRLAAGAYDTLPMLIDVSANSVRAEQAVAVARTFTIPPGVTPAGPVPTAGETTRLEIQADAGGIISALTFFTPPDAPGHPDVLVLSYEEPDGAAPGHVTLELDFVDVGDGKPSRRVVLSATPVQVESFRLYTHIGDAWQEWTRRDDLDASSRTDFHFLLDPMSGQITFGNGERGAVLPEDALILAQYRTTRADAGNVSEGAITQPADTPRNALWLSPMEDDAREEFVGLLRGITTNRATAAGGQAEEELADTIGRAVETLHAHERLLDLCAESKCQTLDQIDRQRVRTLPAPTRAVNLLDIERLALDVPGTKVVRARAWANLHPAYPCLQAPGVVTVVIIPDLPVNKPEPSRGLLEAVKRYLDRRRLVTTRLEVVGPDYLEVRINASVRAQPHSDLNRVKAGILQALDAFLDPLHGGPEPEGQGWPFGRDVYRSEVLQVIDNVPGVDHVLKLSLSAGAGEPRCGNIPLCPTWLVTPGGHQIETV
jgi:hypothetical protein